MSDTTTETTVDIPLLRKLVEWVEEQDAVPEETRQWRQEVWIDYNVVPTGTRTLTIDCGTACCACGKLALDAGAVVTGSYATGDFQFDELHPIEYGATALGIDWESACRLFEPDNSASDIREVAEEIAGCRL